MNAGSTPPPVLGSSRVLAFARVPAALGFVSDGASDAQGAALGRVPNLAVAESLDDAAAVQLLYCDVGWQVLASRSTTTADAAKALAERSYEGVAQCWLPAQVSRDDALAYYDRSNENSRCSFCSKRAFEVAMLIEGARGTVCNECVARFRRATASN